MATVLPNELLNRLMAANGFGQGEAVTEEILVGMIEQRLESNREIIALAHEHGWDGVTNSKILTHFLRARLELAVQAEKPIDMILFCPNCGFQHVDKPEPDKDWTNPPHKSHLCHNCAVVWRPADVATNGVAFIKTKGDRDSELLFTQVDVEGVATKVAAKFGWKEIAKPFPEDAEKGLTHGELFLVELLGEWWNQACRNLNPGAGAKSRTRHESTMDELNILVHALQDKIMARAAVRSHPDIFHAI